MLLQDRLHAVIQEIHEGQQNSEVEPEYLKTLFSDHSHLLVDYDTIEYCSL